MYSQKFKLGVTHKLVSVQCDPIFAAPHEYFVDPLKVCGEVLIV